jgi:fimbrial chaperone protein
MRSVLTLGLGIIAVLLSTISTAQAMTVSPLQVEMTSTGSRSSARITVINNSAKPLPVEAVIEQLTLDENGKQKTQKAGEEFLILPMQAMIPPGGTQNFRVQWLGEPLLGRSQSYMLFINQIPVKLPQGQSGVQVVTGMGVMVNVAPPKAAPALNVVATSISTDKQGRRFPIIVVENPTNVHALLPKSNVHLSSGNWSDTVSAAVLEERMGIGLVQPGRRRKFVLPVELPMGVMNVNARVEFSAVR